MKKTILVVVCFLSACSAAPKVSDYQRVCEAQHSAFSGEIICLRQAIMTDSRLSKNELAKYFLLQGEKYSEDIEKGLISEAEARLKLQALYIKLKEKEHQEALARRAAFEEQRERDAHLSQMRALRPIGSVNTTGLMVGKQEFCNGFAEGYKSIKGEMGLVPMCPMAPITPMGSTAFREGIKAGIRAAGRY